MHELENTLKLPDIWQQEAVKHLQDGKDVVVHAPTGAGKTYIFELFARAGLRRQAIYTVPTRALANDKLYEWRSQGWNVGISTGDLSEKTDAPVVVATLETQKGKFLRGMGPGLLVIDEYQMLADATRGVNYELAVALAPPGTQLLLLSGSVSNPQRVVEWLRRIGRDAELVFRVERPVPQEEIQLEALPNVIPTSIRGFWPRFIARALAAELGPLLVFAPRRKAAEDLARQLSAALPLAEWLELSSEQKALAGEPLSKMLRNRIAYHHSGLSYQQRAGLIEPLAKAGQLRVIVATTGLAAGINFCMRSVIVTDREYQLLGRSEMVRPDELLQMFGRAGRRGLDHKGYILVAPGKPRLSEARPLSIKRSPQVDWTSFLAVMHQARIDEKNPMEAAEELSCRLFTDSPVRLGLRRFKPQKPRSTAAQDAFARTAARTTTIKEMLNSERKWERQKAPIKVPIGSTLLYKEGRWRDTLREPESLAGVKVGALCKLQTLDGTRYGRQLALANFPDQENSNALLLTKWIHRSLREYYNRAHPDRRSPGRQWPIKRIEQSLLPMLPSLTFGGRMAGELVEDNGVVSVRLDYSEATVFARVDSAGRALINPPVRERTVDNFPTFAELAAADSISAKRTTAEVWHQLGLIDEHKRATRRGVIFSFFNHGEGLAIAAALEDTSYPLEDLLYDVANLRAGHRFDTFDNTSSRLGSTCRMAYRGITCAGYLEQGIPPEYGNGAAEVLSAIRRKPQTIHKFVSENLGSGDIERAELEWRSILNHIFFAPDYPWERWRDFKDLVHTFIASNFAVIKPAVLPALTANQRNRYHCRL